MAGTNVWRDENLIRGGEITIRLFYMRENLVYNWI